MQGRSNYSFGHAVGPQWAAKLRMQGQPGSLRLETSCTLQTIVCVFKNLAGNQYLSRGHSCLPCVYFLCHCLVSEEKVQRNPRLEGMTSLDDSAD